MSPALQHLLDEAHLGVRSPTGPGFWPVYVAISAVLYGLLRRRQTRGQRGRAPGFFAYLLPRAVYLHPSARLDFQMLLINGIVAATAALLGFASGFGFMGMLAALRHGSLQALARVLPHPASFTGILHLTGFARNLGFTVAVAVARDVARVLVHYPMHKVPALWEIHRVHHTAEVLTPFTAYRLHPIEMALSSLSGGACYGICVVGFAWLFGPERLSLVTVLGISAVSLVTHAMGLFEHGNKWFSLGPLGFIFSNPAGHLVHHSSEPRHRDKNFSNHFAFIDLILGTLYIPRREEHFPIGVRGPEGRPAITRCLLRHFYFDPVLACARRLGGRPRACPPPGRPAEEAATLHCWCGPHCPVLAEPHSPAAQPVPAWTGLGDLVRAARGAWRRAGKRGLRAAGGLRSPSCASPGSEAAPARPYSVASSGRASLARASGRSSSTQCARAAVRPSAAGGVPAK